MDGTSTLGKRRPSLNQLDNDPTAKRIGQQLRADLDLQQDLLRSMTTYRRALEAVAEASESVAQVIGRLQINTLTAHSALKEVRQQLDMPPVEAAAADKHKQLSLALQQMVKFHTMQTNQQLELANAIVYEFDRPLQLNMDSMRPALAVGGLNF